MKNLTKAKRTAVSTPFLYLLVGVFGAAANGNPVGLSHQVVCRLLYRARISRCRGLRAQQTQGKHYLQVTPVARLTILAPLGAGDPPMMVN